MDHTSLTRFSDHELPELMTELDAEYYKPIEALCHSAGSRVELLLENDIDAAVTFYIGLARDLILQVESYLRLREEVLVPYLKELSRKESERHDCRECAGNCNMQHAVRLSELKMAHASIKQLLHLLQQTHLPPYTGEQKGAFRLLRNEIMLLDAAIEEVFEAEDSRLLPRITAAQMKIHA